MFDFFRFIMFDVCRPKKSQQCARIFEKCQAYQEYHMDCLLFEDDCNEKYHKDRYLRLEDHLTKAVRLVMNSR